jgi:hypothetical protein
MFHTQFLWNSFNEIFVSLVLALSRSVFRLMLFSPNILRYVDVFHCRQFWWHSSPEERDLKLSTAGVPSLMVYSLLASWHAQMNATYILIRSQYSTNQAPSFSFLLLFFFQTDLVTWYLGQEQPIGLHSNLITFCCPCGRGRHLLIES